MNQNDLKHYLSLAAMLSLAIGIFWFFNFQRQVQVLVIILTAVAYVLWGIMHHKIKKDLSKSIVAEYLLIATVASLMLITLLFRA